MAVSKKTDSYANVAAIRVPETAAATQTSKKFAFPFSIMDKMALIISRVEYWIASYAPLNGSTDLVVQGITAAASIVDLGDQSNPLIIDTRKVERIDYGTAASSILRDEPYVKDFSDLPGGGLLVAPNPLYGIIQGVGTTPAFDSWIRLYYTYIELATDEYWQLVESRRIISS